MANSALKGNPFFNGQAAAQGYGQAGAPQQAYGQPYAQQGFPQQAYGQQAGVPQAPYGQQPLPTPDQMNAQFQAPAASRDQMDRMSYEDVIAKTAGLFAVLLIAAAAAWFFPILMLPGALGALALGLVLAFKKTPAPGLTFAFAAAEGLMVGGFSGILEAQFAGIVMQAALATFAVIGVTLLLFMNGKVRTSPKMNKFVMISLFGMLGFSLLNFVLMLTPMGQEMGMFGMRSVEIGGIPIGLVIGVFAVFLGTYMLVSDFEFVQRGVQTGAPRSYGWIAGYAIVSTVVYIYIEILRLIAIFRNN